MPMMTRQSVKASITVIGTTPFRRTGGEKLPPGDREPTAYRILAALKTTGVFLFDRIAQFLTKRNKKRRVWEAAPYGVTAPHVGRGILDAP